jgi:hypothetical protein
MHLFSKDLIKSSGTVLAITANLLESQCGQPPRILTGVANIRR